MKKGGLFAIVTFCIFTTSCSTLISTKNIASDRSPVERSFYNQGSIFNKTLFAETKLAETKPIKEKRQKTAMEELNEIHRMAINSFVYQIMAEAESYLGVPYRYGGTTRSGIDCSAFVQRVFHMFDQQMPRVSAAQAKEGRPITKEELRAGDLVFFATNGGKRVSHVGIVHNVTEEGDVEFIHASTSIGVTVTPLSNDYWSKRFLYAKRVID